MNDNKQDVIRGEKAKQDFWDKEITLGHKKIKSGTLLQAVGIALIIISVVGAFTVLILNKDDKFPLNNGVKKLPYISEVLLEDNSSVKYECYGSIEIYKASDEIKTCLSDAIKSASSVKDCENNIDWHHYSFCLYVYSKAGREAYITINDGCLIVDGKYKCEVDKAKLADLEKMLYENKKTSEDSRKREIRKVTGIFEEQPTVFRKRELDEQTSVFRQNKIDSGKKSTESTTRYEDKETITFRAIDSLDFSEIIIIEDNEEMPTD